MGVSIFPMTLADYDEVLALWRSTEGVGVNESDSRENIGRYLERNPGLSLVARDGMALVGAVLCGHDGRRGYLVHLAVAASHRRRGIGTMLVETCLNALRRAGICRCYLSILDGNENARAFYRSAGWREPEDFGFMYRDIPAETRGGALTRPQELEAEP